MFRIGPGLAIALSAAVLFTPSLRAQEPTSTPAAPGPTAPQDSPPSVPHPKRIRVGGNVQMANVTHRVSPVYPPLAQQVNVSGTVVLHIIVANDGTVKQADYVSGPLLFMRAAIDAVKQWRYRPTLLNGQPIEVDTRIGFVFALTRTGPKIDVIAPPPDAPPSQQEKNAPAATPEKPAYQPPAASDSKPAGATAAGQVEQAKLTHMVQPVYPEDARKANISGTARLFT